MSCSHKHNLSRCNTAMLIYEKRLYKLPWKLKKKMTACIPAESAHKVVKRFLSIASAPCKRDGRAKARMLTAMVTNPWGQRILTGSPPNIWLLNVHTQRKKRKWNEMHKREREKKKQEHKWYTSTSTLQTVNICTRAS